MPRCRDSIVNGRHLANEKQTKRDARKFALAKTLLTLDRQTGKFDRGTRSSQSPFKSERRASDEFRRANQIIKNVVKSKRLQRVKIVNSLQKKWIGY